MNGISADCHYGDHRWMTNGRCSDCDAFNGGWLAFQAYAKAERDGLTHGDHYHRTADTKAACRSALRYPPDPRTAELATGGGR